ncbi:MAG: helix-turn-helix domain-containing protein [Clostridia bacterium]|nr:helix-turn-helix domain-containing protein [Clostridia bacterium]
MLAENLVILRTIKGMSQEQIAEIVGISRQSYAKWEQGETIPTVDKCAKLAEFYGITVDSLINQNDKIGNTRIPPAPVGKHIWGSVVLGSRGQIVIPNEARKILNLNDGDRLIVLGDDKEGIALVKAEVFEEKIQTALELSQRQEDM